MKIFVRSCFNQIMHKRIDESNMNIRHLTLQSGDISYFNLSTNPIISFIHDGKRYYFRECPQRLSFQTYYQKSIDRFFSTLNNLYIQQEHFKQEIPIKIKFSANEIKVFRHYINEKQKNKNFWKFIANADQISIQIHFSIWEKQRYDLEFFRSFSFGDIPHQCYDIGIYFLWCMRGAASIYRTRNISHSSQYSYFSAIRSIASKIVAESIGLGHMITTSELCRLEFENGTSLLGTISPAADGNRMLDADVLLNGSLQKELLNLSILDLICFQTDHGMNNYNICKRENEYAICAFDNDNPNTFFPFPSIRHNFLGCSPIVDKQGRYNRPYISEELLHSIQQVDIAALKRSLKPYLNSFQLAALICRIKKFQRIFSNLSKKEPQRILKRNQWNDRTVSDEINGNYGKTYLTIVVKGKNI